MGPAMKRSDRSIDHLLSEKVSGRVVCAASGSGARSRRAALLRDAGHARFQLFDQMFALAFAPERAGDFSDVLPDVGEGVGLKRYDLHPPSTPRA